MSRFGDLAEIQMRGGQFTKQTRYYAYYRILPYRLGTSVEAGEDDKASVYGYTSTPRVSNFVEAE